LHDIKNSNSFERSNSISSHIIISDNSVPPFRLRVFCERCRALPRVPLPAFISTPLAAVKREASTQLTALEAHACIPMKSSAFHPLADSDLSVDRLIHALLCLLHDILSFSAGLVRQASEGTFLLVSYCCVVAFGLVWTFESIGTISFILRGFIVRYIHSRLGILIRVSLDLKCIDRCHIMAISEIAATNFYEILTR